MMTARFRPVSALAFRHTRRHIRRRTISCLVSYWRPMGRVCGLGTVPSLMREWECVLGLGQSILPGVIWSRRFLTSHLSMTPPCPYMVMPLAQLLLSRTLLLQLARVGWEPEGPPPCPTEGAPTSRATARVGPTVLPVVNTDRVIAFVVSGQNGMLRRRILSSDSPGPLLDFSSACSSSSTLGLAPL